MILRLYRKPDCRGKRLVRLTLTTTGCCHHLGPAFTLCRSRRDSAARAALYEMSNDCATRVAWGFGVGGALGASIGAMYGTYGAFKHRVPGLFKIRFIGQSTVQTGLAFGVFLAAGSFLQCGR